MNFHYLYLDEKTGSLYWYEDDTNIIMQAPISKDGRIDTNEACEVTEWESPEDEKRIKSMLNIK